MGQIEARNESPFLTALPPSFSLWRQSTRDGDIDKFRAIQETAEEDEEKSCCILYAEAIA